MTETGVDRPSTTTTVRTSRRRLLVGAGGAVVLGTGAVLGAVLGGEPAGARAWGRTLRQGTRGADVRELQVRVAGWAASGPQRTYLRVDGDFGPATAAAVRRFQRAYGLAADGIVGRATQSRLNALESADGSTAHFDWSEFTDHSSGTFGGGKVGVATVRENVRRLMYKLEALRAKLGGRAMTVRSAFRGTAHNRAVGGASNSMHLYGVAADVLVSGVAMRTLYQKAETCGFSGLERYTVGHQHVDSRVEYSYGARGWWWESGTI